MDLTDKLVADFVKAAAPKQERKPEEYTIAGVVQSVNNNGTAMVLFDGATSATECQTAVSVSAGDKVIVSVRDRQGTVTSNVTRVTINADYLEGGSAKFSGELQAATGTFAGSLSAASGSFKGSLSAATGSFTGAVEFTWIINSNAYSNVYIGDKTKKGPIYMVSPMLGPAETIIQAGDVSVYNGSSAYYKITPYGPSSGSDVRIKRNIVEIDAELAKKLKPVAFNYVDCKPSEVHYGFIAQEVEPLMPSVVTKNENGIRGLTYSDFIAPTLALAQENAREIEALKQEIAELKGVINELKHNSESSNEE